MLYLSLSGGWNVLVPPRVFRFVIKSRVRAFHYPKWTKLAIVMFPSQSSLFGGRNFTQLWLPLFKADMTFKRYFEQKNNKKFNKWTDVDNFRVIIYWDEYCCAWWHAIVSAIFTHSGQVVYVPTIICCSTRNIVHGSRMPYVISSPSLVPLFLFVCLLFRTLIAPLVGIIVNVPNRFLWVHPSGYQVPMEEGIPALPGQVWGGGGNW